MSLRFFPCLIACVSLFGLFGSTTRAESPEQPNFVLIYADDLDFDEIGVYDLMKVPCYAGMKSRGIAGPGNEGRCYDDTRVLTPYIDSLARDGVVFDRFYVTSAVCTPSRFGLITGRYASRSEDFQVKTPPGTQATLRWDANLTADEHNIAKALKANGYATGVVGKWHNFPNGNQLRGRDIPVESDPRDPKIAALLQAQFNLALETIRTGYGFDYVDRLNIGNTEQIKPEAIRGHNLEWNTEGALEFLDTYHAQPFFLYMPLSAPHGRYPAAGIDKYDPLATTGGMLDEAPQVQPSRESVKQRVAEAGISKQKVMATWIDDTVGAVLNKLDALGVADNTMVLFISDHQSRGKYTCYEGARVPAMIRWPGRIEPGTRVGQLCANIDVVSTLVDAAGGEMPDDVIQDGRSFLPLITGRGAPDDWRQSLMLEMSNIRAVVMQDWKLIANRATPKDAQAMEAAAKVAARTGERRAVGWDGMPNPHGRGVRYNSDAAFPCYFDPDQLYHLSEDVLEQTNLAANPEYAAKLAEMKGRLSDHLKTLPHTFAEFTEE